MRLVRAIIRLFGLVCMALAVLLGLLALVGFTQSDNTAERVIAGVVAGIAWLLAFIGLRSFRRRNEKSLISSTARRAPSPRAHTGLRFEDFQWGSPPPSRKQFGYAMSLGAKLHDGMTKSMISDAIDEAIEHQRSGEPATKEQLRIIKEYHGLLPRAVTRGEAQRIIEFLEDHTFPCPFCGIEVMAIDDVCGACDTSLRSVKIPIKL